MRARLIDGLCQRYGCPPSVILAEDAHTLLQIVNLVAAYEKETAGGQ